MFPSPDLGKGSMCSQDQYWETVLYAFQSNAEKRFLVPQTSTGIGSIGSPDQYWEKDLKVQTLGKHFIGSPLLGIKVVYFLKSNTAKRL